MFPAGDGESAFNKDRVSVRDDEKVPETESGEGWAALRMHRALLHCALRSGYNTQLYVTHVLPGFEN